MTKGRNEGKKKLEQNKGRKKEEIRNENNDLVLVLNILDI